MKVILAGGTGFLGQALCARLQGAGHDIAVLSREDAAQPSGAGVRTISWDPDGSIAEWAYEVDGADAVVNLAGANLGARRWTPARKAVLIESRVNSTRSLVTAVRIAKKRPPVFVQASAVGFYGHASGSRELDESFPPGSDFLARLCVAWEAEAHPAASLGCRLVILRAGIVLSRQGGALERLMPPFRFFVGGPLGSGRQYVSWIHVDDWVGMVMWALTEPSAAGVLNATAPEPVTNAAFSSAVGRALHRPSWLPAPAFALRLIAGEIADAALLNGQRVIPAGPLALGFAFRYRTIDEALGALGTPRV